MKIITETSRLLLRELTGDDLDFMSSMMTHPEQMLFYPQGIYTRRDAEVWLDRQLIRYAEFGHGLWLVHDKEKEHPVGLVGLITQLVEGEQEPEIGYLIHPAQWRQGYASEAACAVRDYAFGVLGYDHVISLIRPINTASRAVSRKVGMKPVKLTLFVGLEHHIWRMERER